MSSSPKNSTLWLALLTVYLVWGSTYLAIRYGVLVAPPYLFASARFTVAGLAVLAYARITGLALPKTGKDWRTIAITGGLLLAGANGLVTWAEQWVASGQAALMVATSALWMAWLGTLGKRGERISGRTWLGLALGFVGVAVLVGDGLLQKSGPPGAYLALLVSALLWASGSIYARRNPVTCAPPMTAALQMLVAAVLMGGIGLVGGELPRWQMNSQSWAALAYLAVFGSCIGYAAYFWLVHNTTPAVLGTYAYVNPAVAVALGSGLADEAFTLHHAVGTGVILLGVVVVTLAQRKPKV